MALSLSRLTRLPHSFKIVTLVLNFLLIIALLRSPSLPAGGSLVWFTVALAICLDLIAVTLLIFELEVQIFPIKIVTYNSAECGASLTLSIFYFMCMWLLIGGGELALGGWFTTAAILCLSLSAVYTCNFISFLRQWMAEQRQARSQANLYEDFGSYGAP